VLHHRGKEIDLRRASDAKVVRKLIINVIRLTALIPYKLINHYDLLFY
jgi:hypothetical protein